VPQAGRSSLFCLRHAVLTQHTQNRRALGTPAKRPKQLRHLTKPVGEQSTGACIGTHYPRLPFASRLRLRRRGCVDPAELPLCAALFRGGSISRHPPPTENLVREQSDCGWWARTTVIALQQSLTEVSAIYATDRMFEDITIHAGLIKPQWAKVCWGYTQLQLGRLSNEVTVAFATQGYQ